MLYLDGTKLIAIQNAASKIDLPQFKLKNSGENLARRERPSLEVRVKQKLAMDFEKVYIKNNHCPSL